jgi:hypothetical protein
MNSALYPLLLSTHIISFTVILQNDPSCPVRMSLKCLIAPSENASCENRDED